MQLTRFLDKSLSNFILPPILVTGFLGFLRLNFPGFINADKLVFNNGPVSMSPSRYGSWVIESVLNKLNFPFSYQISILFFVIVIFLCLFLLSIILDFISPNKVFSFFAFFSIIFSPSFFQVGFNIFVISSPIELFFCIYFPFCILLFTNDDFLNKVNSIKIINFFNNQIIFLTISLFALFYREFTFFEVIASTITILLNNNNSRKKLPRKIIFLLMTVISLQALLVILYPSNNVNYSTNTLHNLIQYTSIQSIFYFILLTTTTYFTLIFKTPDYLPRKLRVLFCLIVSVTLLYLITGQFFYPLYIFSTIILSLTAILCELKNHQGFRSILTYTFLIISICSFIGLPRIINVNWHYIHLLIPSFISLIYLLNNLSIKFNRNVRKLFTFLFSILLACNFVILSITFSLATSDVLSYLDFFKSSKTFIYNKTINRDNGEINLLRGNTYYTNDYALKGENLISFMCENFDFKSYINKQNVNTYLLIQDKAKNCLDFSDDFLSTELVKTYDLSLWQAMPFDPQNIFPIYQYYNFNSYLPNEWGNTFFGKENNNYFPFFKKNVYQVKIFKAKGLKQK